jgi:peptidyl-prolyl cis-trans isomerase-like 6
MPQEILVVGSTSDPDVYYARQLAQKIQGVNADTKVECKLVLEYEYWPLLESLKAKYGGAVYQHKLAHIVIRNGNYVGSADNLVKICTDEYGIEDALIKTDTIFNRLAREETQNLLLLTGHKYVYLDFAEQSKKKGQNQITYGKIVIELFNDICPVACDNFYKLCTGEKGNIKGIDLALKYAGSNVHRIVPGGWIQLGDIIDGSGNYSIAALNDDGKVRDESYSIDFGCALGGIVGFSTSCPHTIGSQFHITLGPCEWMNDKFVGVGRVIAGYDVLRRIEQLPTENQKPTITVFVENCGKFL